MANDGLWGRGFGKKRMTSCNERYRGTKFALTRKGADLPNGVSLYDGGKPVNYEMLERYEGKLSRTVLR